MSEVVWARETPNFRIEYRAEPDEYLDLSWDETGEVAAKIKSGEYVGFVATVRVIFKPTGCELAASYLSGCIYENPSDFIDYREVAKETRALRAQGSVAVVGSYFADMVREAVRTARQVFTETHTAMQKTKVRRHSP